jgi:DNA-binding HxlR family transcriptional regulator
VSTSTHAVHLPVVPLRRAHGTGIRDRPPLEIAREALEGRYRPQIVWGLFWGTRPFSELMRHIPAISKKALRRELADMERLGLVRRAVRPGENRRAEYSLTPLGETLRPLVGAMYEWGLLRLRIERRTASLTLPAPAPPGPGVAAVRASGPQS